MKKRSDAWAAKARAQALGSAIRRRRGQMTQTELADRLSVSQSAVSQWETGIAQITAEHVIRLERELGLRPGTLFVEAGYVDDSLLGIDGARLIALRSLESAVALLAGTGSVGGDQADQEPEGGDR